MIRKATFLVSNSDLTKCPKPDRAEIAFIGRSNVGKSSLINMLTGVKELAKTSQKPGKTQLINHFTIDDRWFLVDLPGYGFAKVSKDKKVKWEKMISEYLTTRSNLCGVFVLIDSRHEPQQIDLDFVNALGGWQIPFVLVFTKADKDKPGATLRHRDEFLQALMETWEEAPPHVITSAVDRRGRPELLKHIAQLNQEYRPT